VLSTITTTRKFVTIVVTGLVYPDEWLSTPQWLCTVVVFAGIVMGEFEPKAHGEKGAAKKTDEAVADAAPAQKSAKKSSRK